MSDFHIVVNANWNNMKETFYRAINEKLKNVPQGKKLLVITGDFHNFGENSFEQTKIFLSQLVNIMEINPAKDIFVVPGNHDISINMSSKHTREDAIAYVKDHPENLSTRMDTLLSCYGDYLDFLQNLNIYATDTNLDPVSVHVRNWRGKLNILHLNTTLISDGTSKKDQMTDTTTATSDEVRELLRKDNLPCLALGHNSFFDLDQSQRKQLSAMFLHENISAYLCGDRHVINTENKDKTIPLEEHFGAIEIPNIVSYRSSTDETDTYSDFGMIWHIWDETSGKVSIEYMRWDPNDQGNLKPDGVEQYFFRKCSISFQSVDKLWLSNNAIAEKGNKRVKECHIKNFLLGYRNNCSLWSLVFSDRIVHREIVESLYDTVLVGGIYALTAPGGEGKSTVLMQLCVQLIKHQIPVFYYCGHKVPSLPEIIPENSIFVIDSPPDIPSFKKFLDCAINKECTLILGIRENEWNLMKHSLKIKDSDVYDIPMPKVTCTEAEQFANCIYDHLNHTKNKQKIEDIFKNNSYGFLYAAMLLAVSEHNTLEDIAHQIVENLSDRSRIGLILLGSVVLSEHYEIKFTYTLFRYFCDYYDIPPGYVTKATSREILINGNRYQTRHIVISHLFYQELFSDHGYLLPDEVNHIFTNLMEFFLKRYRTLNGFPQSEAWNSIMRLCRGLDQVDLDTQKHIINRILEEVRSKFPKTFYQLPSFFEQKEVRKLFYQHCFDQDLFSTSFLREWCDLLLKEHILWTDPDPYAPAQIFREACVNKKADSNAWLAWAQLEAKKSGPGDYETEYTARWIFREVCINRNINGHVWMAWAQLETKESGPGDYKTEYTARWIFRETCINKKADSITWMAWAQLEAKESGPGDYETEYTARWIFREACINKKADSNTWMAWAQLEAKESGPGDYETEYTARWIFREACINRYADGHVWLAWAQLETDSSDSKDYDTKYTAHWIFQEGIERYPNFRIIYLPYACLELSQNHISHARTILRNSLKYSDFSSGPLAILEFFCGNIDSGDVYCVNQLIKRLRAYEKSSLAAVWYLYHCMILLGKTENAQQYHDLFLHHLNDDPTNTVIENYICLCKKAVLHKKNTDFPTSTM